MSEIAGTDLYVKGRDCKLDKKYSGYKKLSLWSGPGVSCALSEDEANSLVDLWKKDQSTPWKLTFQDVWTLVELTSRICSFRINMKRQKARVRKERSREKIRNAAREGDAKARVKINQIKKGDKERAAKYYILKRKSKRKNLTGGAKTVRVKRKKTGI